MVEICNGVLQCLVLQVFGRQFGERRRETPVSVLNDNDGSTNLLSNNSSSSSVGEVTALI